MQHAFTVIADAADSGLRVDKFLAVRVPELSRARVKALLEAGGVRRDGHLIAEGSAPVKPGQSFTVLVPPPAAARPSAEDLALDVLFEDEHLLVLDKRAGMVVHPAAGHYRGTLVNALLHHCAGSLSGIGGVERPGIVHRLDKDVSGLMVVAKHDRAHIGLSAQFTVHSIERAYKAIVWGVPREAEGRIEAPIGRHPKDRKRMAVVPLGKPAATRYRVEQAAGLLGARLKLELETGRTHQIRVHLGTLGLGIVGDPVYRPRRARKISDRLATEVKKLDRIALHAYRLGFEHPISGKTLLFERLPPAIFDEILEHMLWEWGSFSKR